MWSLLTAMLAVCLVAVAADARSPGARATTGAEIWLRWFLSASAEYTLVPFWFWNDDLDDTEIRRQIDDFAAHGVYGFVIHARIGLPRSTPFMSERFLSHVRAAVEHAARLGMVVHLYDEGMYPSGSACGQVVAENPRLAARCLLARPLLSGERQEARPGETLVTTATAPDGSRFAIVDAPSLGRIRGVHFGQDDGEPDQPSAADILNPETTATFIRHVHDRYYAALAPHFGKTVRAIFVDEPSMLGRAHRPGARPWTTGLERWLSQRLRYDVAPRLLELFTDVRPDSARFREIVDRAIQARLEESFYAPLSAWCAAHGIALTGHPAGPGEIGILRHFQLPGQDIVWRYVEPGKPSAIEGPQSCVAKCSASAKEHLGRQRNGNEVFGAYGWELSYEEMRWLTDWLLVRGVDLLWPHAFYYSVRGPRRDERPPDVGPNNVWWPVYRPYADYCRRMCRVVAEARHAARIAILSRPETLPWAAARACFESQRDFAYLEERHLEDGSARVSSRGVAIGRMRYDVVIVDEPMRDRLPRALDPLRAAGRVIAYGPTRVPGLPTVDGAPVLVRWLQERSPADLVLSPAAPSVRSRPMVVRGRRVWMLFNEGEDTVRTVVSTPAVKGPLWRIDPWEGVLRGIVTPAGGELHLAPHEVALLVQAKVGQEH